MFKIKTQKTSILYLFFLLYVSHEIYAQGDEKIKDSFRGAKIERVGVTSLPPSMFNSQNIHSSIQREQKLAEKSSFEEKMNMVDSTYYAPRGIYLNDQNISSVKDEELEGVNVKIDKNGNIFIYGSHYEVSAKDSYHPLLPTELPKLKKEPKFESSGINGVYSKETGKISQEISNDIIEQDKETPEPPPFKKMPDLPAPETKKTETRIPELKN